MLVEFSEKAIMLCKAAAMGDSDGYRSIAMAVDPRSAKAKGREVYPFDHGRWQVLICHVAREVCWQKFSQVPRLTDVLLGTGDRVIAEATRRDQIWGIGLDMKERGVGVPAAWRGTNVLGWALMQVRGRLRAAAEGLAQ